MCLKCLCCTSRAEARKPPGLESKGDCEKIPLDKYLELLKETCPQPPRDLYFYDEKGALQHHFDFCMYDRETDRFYTKAADKVYRVFLSEETADKHRNRWDQMHCVDQYLRQFTINDSPEVFIKFNEAIRREVTFDNCCHRHFHMLCCACCEAGSDQDRFTVDERITLELRPAWFPERIAFLFMIFRCALNSFYIIAQFEQLRTNLSDRNWPFLILAWVIQCVEAYMFVAQLLRVYTDFWALFKRRFLTYDTTHFQCKNIANDMISLSSVSILRYLPSTETVAMAFKRGGEWYQSFIARMEFEMYAIPRFQPWMIMIREIFEALLKTTMPFIAPFALLTKVSSMPWMTHKRVVSWSYYQFFLYFGFVNQLSGLRSIKRIESSAIEHLMFSGKDAKLQLEEHLMINAWWNYVLVSAVSNVAHKLDYPLFDSIVFWYGLSPRKLQMIIKQHGLEGTDIVELERDHKTYRLKSKFGYKRKDEPLRRETVTKEALLQVGVDGAIQSGELKTEAKEEVQEDSLELGKKDD